MLIILGPDFPMERPLLKITPSISHQWVNENSEIVSAPGFLNVSRMKLLLNGIVLPNGSFEHVLTRILFIF